MVKSDSKFGQWIQWEKWERHQGLHSEPKIITTAGSYFQRNQQGKLWSYFCEGAGRGGTRSSLLMWSTCCSWTNGKIKVVPRCLSDRGTPGYIWTFQKHETNWLEHKKLRGSHSSWTRCQNHMLPSFLSLKLFLNVYRGESWRPEVANSGQGLALTHLLGHLR